MTDKLFYGRIRNVALKQKFHILIVKRVVKQFSKYEMNEGKYEGVPFYQLLANSEISKSSQSQNTRFSKENINYK